MNSSPAHSDLSSARSLRVRMDEDDAQIYTAGSLADLQAWARDGRVAPTSELSVDDGPWCPIATFRELAMDWVAILPDGGLYGPVHRSALEALLAEGSLPAGTPLFRRSSNAADSRAALERKARADSEARVRELEAALAEARQALRTARAEAEEARGSVQARDIEAGAERQEHEAAVARLNAEAVKRDARANALERKAKELEEILLQRDRDASDRERQVFEARQARAAAEEQLSGIREELEAVRASLATARGDVARARRQANAAKTGSKRLRLREESARKLLQQALSALGGDDKAADDDILDVEVDVDNGDAPQPANPSANGIAIDALEAQARKELRQFGATPSHPTATPEDT
ncbi:MAG: hypothetical protein ACOX5G_08235 [Kiritimatiellia bacterium]